jgi:hypothetical protein
MLDYVGENGCGPDSRGFIRDERQLKKLLSTQTSVEIVPRALTSFCFIEKIRNAVYLRNPNPGIVSDIS